MRSFKVVIVLAVGTWLNPNQEATLISFKMARILHRPCPSHSPIRNFPPRRPMMSNSHASPNAPGSVLFASCAFFHLSTCAQKAQTSKFLVRSRVPNLALNLRTISSQSSLAGSAMLFCLPHCMMRWSR